MTRTTIRLPLGVRDFMPQAANRRRAIADRLMATFADWGFQRVITPLFECADVLERGLGDDARAAAIRFIEPGSGDVVALRPDITPQVARIAATRLADVGGPVRLCYEGSVTRIGIGARGQREVLQAGVELLDAGGPAADAELLALASTALGTTSAAERTLELGHVALSQHALQGIEDSDVREELVGCLLRKDRLGVGRAAQGLPTRQRKLLEALPVLFGTPTRVFKQARELSLPRAASKAVDELEASLEMAATMVVDAELLNNITVDLGELRGFEYYTGMRIAAFVHGAGTEILCGGRYDNLVERYGRKACATGFAIDVEALAQAESATKQGPAHEREGVLLVADAPSKKIAAKIALALRAEGLRVATDLGRSRSKKAVLAYARRVSLPSVVQIKASGAQILFEDGRVQDISQACIRRAARSDAASLVSLLAGRRA